MVKVVTFHMPVTAAAILPVRCPLSATDKDAPFRYEVQQVATGIKLQTEAYCKIQT